MNASPSEQAVDKVKPSTRFVNDNLILLFFTTVGIRARFNGRVTRVKWPSSELITGKKRAIKKLDVFTRRSLHHT